jgi:hypothetical protein
MVALGPFQIIDIYVDRPDVGVPSQAEQDQPTGYSSNRGLGSSGLAYGPPAASNYPSNAWTGNRQGGMPYNQYPSNNQYTPSGPYPPNQPSAAGGRQPPSTTTTSTTSTAGSRYNSGQPSYDSAHTNYGSSAQTYPSGSTSNNPAYRSQPPSGQTPQTRGGEEDTTYRSRDTTTTAWRR